MGYLRSCASRPALQLTSLVSDCEHDREQPEVVRSGIQWVHEHMAEGAHGRIGSFAPVPQPLFGRTQYAAEHGEEPLHTNDQILIVWIVGLAMAQAEAIVGLFQFVIPDLDLVNEIRKTLRAFCFLRM